jgi:hypothetical protein
VLLLPLIATKVGKVMGGRKKGDMIVISEYTGYISKFQNKF